MIKKQKKKKKSLASLTLSHGTSVGPFMHMQHVSQITAASLWFWVTHNSNLMQSHCAPINLSIIPDKPFSLCSAARGRAMSVHKGEWVHVVGPRLRSNKTAFLLREHQQAKIQTVLSEQCWKVDLTDINIMWSMFCSLRSLISVPSRARSDIRHDALPSLRLTPLILSLISATSYPHFRWFYFFSLSPNFNPNSLSSLPLH